MNCRRTTTTAPAISVSASWRLGLFDSGRFLRRRIEAGLDLPVRRRGFHGRLRQCRPLGALLNADVEASAFESQVNYFRSIIGCRLPAPMEGLSAMALLCRDPAHTAAVL